MKKATLESLLDFYQTELFNLNKLLKQCGFDKGIQTLKKAAKEILDLQNK